MNTQTEPRTTDETRWRPIFADLAFWAVTGAIVAAASAPLADLFDIDTEWLLVGGVLLLAGGIGLLAYLNRLRPTPREVVGTFVVFNLVLAPLAWLLALFQVLPLSTPGHWAVATIGDVALVLGLWQLFAWRTTARA